MDNPTTSPNSPLEGVTALVFDVFGTCVDWRRTVVPKLRGSWSSKASAPDTPQPLREKLTQLTQRDAESFAQQWRNSYGEFTSGYVPGKSVWKDIDTHHRESLTELLESWGIVGAYSSEEVAELSLVWHHLAPWSDSCEGLRRLSGKFVTSTLSNGNQELLRDLNTQLENGFNVLISAADFAAYKPNPVVYRGAAEKLGLDIGTVALVAAHLGDLEAARGCGMKTVYVERPKEEDWEGEEMCRARKWVDIWVSLEEEGFVELARKLGC